jgi:molybdopterin-biosynthesis enzyme MoeA-like protein
MAGVPKIMQAMLDDVAPYLTGGKIVFSRTLKLSYIGESWAADVLRDLDNVYHDLSFGSYPFGLYSQQEYGTQLVVRGQNKLRLDAAFLELIEGLKPVLLRALEKNINANMLETIDP